ncbi:MAG TPA: hypothetical protein ENJ88_04550 [Phaeodactylibacter sp.]|nr:hypothetical protein [Phaeodactylibacter sp.]
MNHHHSLQLLFLPEEGEHQAGDTIYRCFLLNRGEHCYLYKIEADTLTRHILLQKGKLEAHNLIELPKFYKDDLNDKPIYRFSFWVQTNRGTGAELKAEICLRPKNFFSRKREIEMLDNCFGHPYEINLQEQKKESESLQSYTRKHHTHLPKGSSTSYSRRVDIHNPEKVAHFPREIDLHIEALRPNAGKMEASLILQIQLRAFEEYLNEAIRLGIDEILIVHGKGEGVLRSKIHDALDKNPYVKKYEKVHHIFGSGATTVFL